MVRVIIISEAYRVPVKTMDNAVAKRMPSKVQDPCLEFQPLLIPCWMREGRASTVIVPETLPCVRAQLLSHVGLFVTPMDCNPPSSSAHEILQARILEWVTISSSRESSWPRDQTHISGVSCIGRQVLYHWATWEPRVSDLSLDSSAHHPPNLAPMRLTLPPASARGTSLLWFHIHSEIHILSARGMLYPGGE